MVGRVIRWLMVVVAACGVSNSIGYAQTIRTLVYEQSVSGAITRTTFREVYTFPGKSGDIIEATLTVTEGNLDPILILTDSQNNLLSRDDDGLPPFNAVIRTFQLKTSGDHFLLVARFGQERGLTTGRYTLSLKRIGLVGGAAGVILRYGDSVVGEIGEASEQVYGFTARRGEYLSATLQRISGDLDPALILADSNGGILVVNDEDSRAPGTLDAALRDYLIRRTDNYLLVATRFGRQAGTTRGGYTLTLDRLGEAGISASVDRPLLLDPNAPVTGTIDAPLIFRYYLLEGVRGEAVSVEVTRTKGNLDPTVAIYPAAVNGKLALRPLISHDSGIRGQSAKVTRYSFPADGDYWVVVGRFAADKGFTEGEFRLGVISR
jgi:hypothetical protein